MANPKASQHLAQQLVSLGMFRNCLEPGFSGSGFRFSSEGRAFDIADRTCGLWGRGWGCLWDVSLAGKRSGRAKADAMIASDIIIPEHYSVDWGSDKKANKYHSVFRCHAGQPVYTKGSVILGSLRKIRQRRRKQSSLIEQTTYCINVTAKNLTTLT